MKIAEFAWDYEQLLNRVIEKTVPPDRQVIEAVGQAAAALPELVAELKTSIAPIADINYLRGVARALAEFKAEQLLYEHTQRAARAESPDDRISDGDETEWKGIGVGATTQIIPPDKLTEAMLEEIEPDTMQVDSSAFEITRTQSESAEPGLGDTLLAQPPEIPGPDKYIQAVDYAQSEVESANADADKDAEVDKDADRFEATEFEEIAPLARETIKIETVGEDFVGDDFDDDFGDEVAFETALPESTVTESVATDEPEAEARDLAAQFARGPTRGYALIKQAIDAASSNSLDSQLELERDLQQKAGRTSDYAEGVRAFMEKRRPDFQGR